MRDGIRYVIIVLTLAYRRSRSFSESVLGTQAMDNASIIFFLLISARTPASTLIVVLNISILYTISRQAFTTLSIALFLRRGFCLPGRATIYAWLFHNQGYSSTAFIPLSRTSKYI